MTSSPADIGEGLHLRRLDSPIGRIEVVSDGRAITSLAIERNGRLPHDELPEHPDDVLDRAVAQLIEYFAGERRDFDVPVELPGTAFQRAVWEQLVQLQWGEVVSYGELGQATGRPTAGRAVGGAVGANPVPIIVPCHRVLGADGRITGYSGGEGIPTKSWLLAHEGIAHSVPMGASASAVELDLPAA
jgi:methylated-DNA-[protein]-cysteine S-methyltransferase